MAAVLPTLSVPSPSAPEPAPAVVAAASFLGLPVELRLEVYRYLLVDPYNGTPPPVTPPLATAVKAMCSAPCSPPGYPQQQQQPLGTSQTFIPSPAQFHLFYTPFGHPLPSHEAQARLYAAASRAVPPRPAAATLTASSETTTAQQQPPSPSQQTTTSTTAAAAAATTITTTTTPTKRTTTSFPAPHATAILRTSHQIHTEATPILYKSHIFLAHPGSLLTHFPRLSPSHRPIQHAEHSPLLRSLITRYKLHLRLDVDPKFTARDAARHFSAKDELVLEVSQACWRGVGPDHLRLFERVRGVKRARVVGSVGGFEGYAAWLEDSMMAPPGRRVERYDGVMELGFDNPSPRGHGDDDDDDDDDATAALDQGSGSGSGSDKGASSTLSSSWGSSISSSSTVSSSSVGRGHVLVGVVASC